MLDAARLRKIGTFQRSSVLHVSFSTIVSIRKSSHWHGFPWQTLSCGKPSTCTERRIAAVFAVAHCWESTLSKALRGPARSTPAPCVVWVSGKCRCLDQADEAPSRKHLVLCSWGLGSDGAPVNLLKGRASPPVTSMYRMHTRQLTTKRISYFQQGDRSLVIHVTHAGNSRHVANAIHVLNSQADWVHRHLRRDHGCWDPTPGAATPPAAGRGTAQQDLRFPP